jgi:hypothetical protein
MQGAFLEAECKLDVLHPIDLGGKRSFTVGKSLMWIELCGARCGAQVTVAVSLEATPRGSLKLAAVTKDAAAIRFANKTATYISN